jgi:hypothetical protein
MVGDENAGARSRLEVTLGEQLREREINCRSRYSQPCCKCTRRWQVPGAGIETPLLEFVTDLLIELKVKRLR